MSRILRSALVLPVASLPIKDGAVVIRGSLIEAVGRFDDIRQQYQALPVDDLGSAVLMPGLVNAHTHLELTRLRESMPKSLDFVSWLVDLVRQRRRLTEDDLVASAKEGIRELLAGGVTAVGDIATSDIVTRTVLQCPLAGVVFREILGEGGSEAMIEGHGGMRVGLSPHAAYTVPADVFRRIADSAPVFRTPLAIHAAESWEETVFLRDCSGPIADVIYPLARWPLPKPSGLSPVAFLEFTGIFGAKPLLIHGVQVHEDDVKIIARHGLPVVHCPGSNRRLGVGQFPLGLYRKYGINVALGTDSAIGTKRLDMFDEMREAKSLHCNTLSYEETVRMATVNGASVLGLNAGALEPGRRADIIALEVDFDTDDPYRSVVETGRALAVKAVWAGGKAPESV